MRKGRRGPESRACPSTILRMGPFPRQGRKAYLIAVRSVLILVSSSSLIMPCE